MLLSIMGVELEPDDPTSTRGACSAARLRPRRPRLDRRASSAPPARARGGPARRCRSPMWEAINTTYRAIPSGQFRAMRPPLVFQWVRERAALINGTADATMTRDEGWQFLMLGRCIERADMTSRLVATAAVAGGIGSPWTSTLRACGALRGVPAHLPRARRPSAGPRSSCCSTGSSRARWSSRSTAPSSASTTSSRRPARRLPERGAAAARPHPRRARVPLADPTCWPTCRTRWRRLQRTCALATEAITRRYFAGAEAPTWQGVRS